MKTKKIISVLLSCVMVLGLMPSLSFTAYAANVDYTGYSSIEKAGAGDVISLTKNEIVTRSTGTTQIYVKQSCTLNGKGYSFTGNPSSTGNLLYDYSGAKTFNLTNITLSSNNGRILNPRINGSVYNADSSVTFNGGTCRWSGGLAEINSGATLNLNGSDVNGLRSSGSGGAFNNNGTVNLNYTGSDNTIENCFASSNGGVATIGGSGKMTVTDATITNNSANGKGGAIYLSNGGTLTLKGDTNITGNKVSDAENNIYLASGAVITLDGFTGSAGVTTANAPVFKSPVKIATGATAQDATRVTSDNNNYFVEFNADDDCLYLCAPAPTGVAEVNGVGYETLEEAISAASTGDTVTLLKDVDFRETYNWGVAHYIDLSGKTLDLDGHRIDVRNFGVIWTGQDFTIKDGTFVGEKRTSTSYGMHVYGKDNNGPDLGDSPKTGDVPVENATLENLTIVGGVNIWYAENVVLRNCNVTGQNYYAVWANSGSDVTIESGSYTSDCAKTNAILGASKENLPEGKMTVEGGNFTVPSGKELVLTSHAYKNVKISGGTYNVPVPQDNWAEGYVGTTTPDTQGKYTVTKTENAVSITVDSTIKTNFYLDNDYPETAYVKTTYNANSNATQTADFTTQTKQISELGRVTGGDYAGYYTLSVPQAPAQITEDIIVEVYAAD
ncbi:MAG: hypothetical protein J5964_04310, partial [Eubacterium sp.]|nr:hypothetical protein [Eubacterium sp.]